MGHSATSVDGLLPGFSASCGGDGGVGVGDGWEEGGDVSSDDLELLVIGEEEGGKRIELSTEKNRGGGGGGGSDGNGCGVAVETAAAETQRGGQARAACCPPANRASAASRRSHGRSMQVEATHVSTSSGRGTAPNLA